jgi:hypothetical protein
MVSDAGKDVLNGDHDDADLSAREVHYEDAPDLTWLNRRLRDLLMQAPRPSALQLDRNIAGPM